MKKQRLYLVSLCAVLGLSLASCGDDNNDGGGCDPANASKVCGDPSVFYCDAVSKSCKRFLPEHCINKKTDSGSETDVDCGGACVSDAFHSDARNLDYRQRCNVGQTCKRSDDCKSGICEGNVCKVKGCETKADCNADETCDNNMCASCSDGMQNQGETDVDCGGLCASNATPSRCALGKKCKAATDCESGSCEGNVCVASSFEVADPAKLVINEIQVSSKSTPSFALNNDVKACEFVEIANSDPAKGFKLDGIKLIIERKDKEGALEEIDLTGNVIQPRSLVVVHNCETLPLPEKVVGVKSDILALVGSGTYLFKMTLGEKEGSSVSLKLSQYASSYNRETDFDGNANMSKTTAIGKNAAAATPGYCINGGLYHENCVTHCSNNVKDADESGIDCGGALCEKCTDDGDCKVWSDCTSGYCYKNPADGTTDEKGVYTEPLFGICEVCTKNDECKQTNAECIKDPILDEDGEPTGETINYCAIPQSCKDKALNQDETDIDCGGICGSTCRVGQVCGSGLDCMSTICEDGLCAGTDPGITDVNALVINEVYDSSSTTKVGFPYNRNNKTCEFIEIANISDNNISLDGIKLIIKKRDGEGKSKDIELNGALDAKKILLVHSCKDGLDIPTSDARGMLESSLLATTSDYNIYLEDKDGNKSYAFDFYATAKDFTTSMNRETDFDPTSPIAKTTELTNSAEIFATPGYCANGGLLSLGCKTYCADTLLNGNESDIDCGGNCNTACDLGKKCVVGSDCLSNVCKGNVCAKCTSNDQCESGECVVETGLCEQGGGVSAGNPDSLIINEVFDSGAKSPEFILNKNQKACEFIEIANPTNDAISLSGMRLELRQLNEDFTVKSTISIPLSGKLDAQNLLVVNNCAALQDVPLSLPSDAISCEYAKDKLLTGTWTYDIALVTDEKESVQIKGLTIGSVINSSYNRTVDFDQSSPMQKTTDLMSEDSGAFIAFASPGYCANGGTFSSGCKVDCGNHGESCGGICAPCENGKQCSSGDDCATGQCEGGVCSGEILQKADYHKLFVNEVLFAPVTAGLQFNPVQNVNGCKFVEVLNLDASKSYDLAGTQLTIENLGDSSANKTIIPLEGTIQANNAFIVFANKCDASIESFLPAGVNSMRSTKLDPGMSKKWGISVDDGTEDADPTNNFEWTPISKGDGISQTHYPDRDVNSQIVKHTSEGVGIENWNASPGYCVNGKLFKDNCK